ncbi:outer membrane protein assembly factor BamB family protein [Halosimplex salinum]|uniref:outer membrane protein assembly factor BamB family protein n=1 Tax=Halosimplex salinum TaxID=1710538 RepID=UPI000F466010|nr:PQQ-binding-like beta-propeller repeat protein [Halosimplex salinum]
MVPRTPLSRRQVLAAGGSAAALLTGGALARRLLPTAAGSAVADWPMAGRDPAGTAFAPEADPPADGVEVRWRQPLATGGEFRPGPVVADGVVYAAGTDVYAVSASDGEPLARFDRTTDTAPAVASARAYRTRTAAVHESPPFDPHRLAGHHGRGGDSVAGVRVGETRWTATAERDVDSYGAVHYGGGARPPPVAVDWTLLTFFRGTLAAVDASSGAVRWASEKPFTGVRPAVREGVAYVPGPDGGVLAFDVERGDRTRFRPGSPSADRPSSLVATPDRLLVTGDDWIRSLDGEGRVEWESTFDASGSVPVGPIAVANGSVYARRPTASGPRLCSLDATDGSVQWVSDDGSGDADAFLPAVADETVYVPVAESGIAGVDAADGTVRWRFDPGDGGSSPAALAGDALYVVTDEHLYALEEP